MLPILRSTRTIIRNDIAKRSLLNPILVTRVTRGPLLTAAEVLTLVTAALVVQSGAYGKAINSFAGPYIVYADIFYSCGDPGMWQWNLRTSHFNQQKPKDLQIITGNITTYDVLSDKSWVRAHMDSRSNNEWKLNAFVFAFRDKACFRIASNIPGFYDLFFGRGVKPVGTCKIDAGTYVVDHKEIDWTFPNVPIMPYGSYRFRIMMGPPNDFNTMQACFAVECHVYPKAW